MLLGGPRYDAIKWFTDTNSPEEAPLPRYLAESLHDEGYDVFIANPRGTKYSRGHKHISAEHDHEYYGRQKYWDWGVDDLALTDLPAIVDKIIETRKYDMHLCQKVQILTHGKAGNYGLILLNEYPRTSNERIQSLITQAPCYYEDKEIYIWKDEYKYVEESEDEEDKDKLKDGHDKHENWDKKDEEEKKEDGTEEKDHVADAEEIEPDKDGEEEKKDEEGKDEDGKGRRL